MKSNQISRKQALENYYANPNICRNCQTVITVPENRKVKEIRKKLFCTSSCSATYNGTKRTKTPKFCGSCDQEFLPTSYRNSLCPSCKRVSSLPKTTKGELFAKCKNYQSARSIITHDAVRTYEISGRPSFCHICEYTPFTDVCHIKDVKDFPDSALVSEINHINNLVRLCKNHHAEFDNKLFSVFIGCGIQN